MPINPDPPLRVPFQKSSTNDSLEAQLLSLAVSENQILRTKLKWALPWLGMGLCLAMLATHLAFDFVGRNRASGATQTGAAAPPREGTSPVGPGSPNMNQATTVTLGEAKLKAAKITSEPARFDRLPTELGVPGRIDFNTDRRVEIRPRASGIVREVHVVLGQNVKHGDPLITLDSPDVGTARLNLRAKQRELSTARVEAEWKSQVAANVALLIPEIRKGIDPAAIEKGFADKSLGAIVGRSCKPTPSSTSPPTRRRRPQACGTRKSSVNISRSSPCIPARVAKPSSTRQLNRPSSMPPRRSVWPTSTRRSESDVIDAAQRLRILGVSENIRELLDHADKADELAIDEDVTMYRISSPFDGTITMKNAVFSQKADPNDMLFVLADLNTLWVNANITESDVASVPKIKGGAIRITATAYPARVFSATLLSIGAMVDPQTRTVPILTQTDNKDGLLKPGMFVRILLDSPTTELALTVSNGGGDRDRGQDACLHPVGFEKPTITRSPFGPS